MPATTLTFRQAADILAAAGPTLPPALLRAHTVTRTHPGALLAHAHRVCYTKAKQALEFDRSMPRPIWSGNPFTGGRRTICGSRPAGPSDTVDGAVESALVDLAAFNPAAEAALLATLG